MRKKKKPQAAGGKKKREKAAAAAAAAAAKQAEIEARIKEQEEEREAEEDSDDKSSTASGDEDEDSSDDEGRRKRHSSTKQSAHDSPATSGTSTPQPPAPAKPAPAPGIDEDDPELSRPLVRFNVMLAIQRNTLYLYGGIHETSDREYTLDDFYILQLDKLERWVRLRECKIEGLEWNESDDEEEDSDDDDESGSDSDSEDEDNDDGGQAEGVEVDHLREEEEVGDGQDEDDDLADLLGDASIEDVDPAELERLKAQREEIKRRAKEVLEMEEANTNKGKTSKSKKKDKDAKQAEQQSTDLPPAAPSSTESPSGQSQSSAPDSQAHLSTPNPGETLRQFFDRTRTYWTTQALNVHHQEEATGSSNTRSGYGQSGGLGKELRTKGFSMASDRYDEYLPVLREIEKIQAQAGLDKEEMRQSAAKAQNGPLGGGLGVDSRHRR